MALQYHVRFPLLPPLLYQMIAEDIAGICVFSVSSSESEVTWLSLVVIKFKIDLKLLIESLLGTIYSKAHKIRKEQPNICSLHSN